MQTLREVLGGILNKRYRQLVSEQAPPGFLDLTIIDGVGLVAMDVEAGVEMLNWLIGDGADSANGKDEARANAFRAALTACGIIVPDEVETVNEHPQAWVLVRVEDDRVVKLETGDTLTVTRKPKEVAP